MQLTALPFLAQAAEIPKGVKLAEQQTLKRALRGDPESLDPHLAIGTPEDHVTRELFEGLVTQDLQGNIIPGQAESWETSRDGTVWTFTLRKGLRWSNGKPLTAEDFEYSFKRLANPETASPYAWYLAAMGVKNADEITKGKKPVSTLGVKAGPGNTLTLELNRPAPYLLAMLTHRSMNPVPRAAIEAHGRDWVASGKIVNNGPFNLVKRIIREQIVLNQNSNYWNHKNTVLTEITFLPIESETAALNRYRAGELDMVSSVPTTHYKKLINEMPEQLKTSSSLATYYLTFNTREKPFNDVRVRKALSYVLHREKITDNILGQGQKTAYTFTPETVTGFTAPEPDYKKMSPQERQASASKLLKEAGYSKDNPLTFTYIYNATDSNKHIAVAIQEMWQKQLPVKVELENLEWSTYLQRKLDGQYQVARALWGGDYDDAITMLDVHTPEHGNNSSFYNSKRYNQLLDQARQTLDREERNRIYAEAELVLASDMPIAPIYWNSLNYLIKPDLRGISYDNPEGRIYSRDIYKVAQ
ncbi:hypothetical protein GZ78_13135 [Endozoicomonas numazuensis]|uniref:Solute-binding protein family 5 domain-containing protein n=1 Tax=Endozoicomonas numazuensis TaxID=1137799 RepID=A0A081NJ10_9GAMM|nr:hypothetical protein GZ78_13135 [Endozoicomonas numazuensis]